MTDNVLVSIDASGVARVTLNRPEKHNAFDDAVILELGRAFEQVEHDSAARVMILGSNGKSFSAGGDLGWMQRMADCTLEENLADAEALAAMLYRLNFMSKPTIARIQGEAFGGAVGLVSCCDMAIASDQADFALSEVKIGLLPATISPYVIAAIGQRAARRYFLTAERFTAADALRLGLVNEVVSSDSLDERINQLVGMILGNSTAAIKDSKQLIFDVSNRAIDNSLIQETSQRIAATRVSAEGQEGLQAFLERRQPNWVTKPPQPH